MFIDNFKSSKINFNRKYNKSFFQKYNEKHHKQNSCFIRDNRFFYKLNNV